MKHLQTNLSSPNSRANDHSPPQTIEEKWGREVEVEEEFEIDDK